MMCAVVDLSILAGMAQPVDVRTATVANHCIWATASTLGDESDSISVDASMQGPRCVHKAAVPCARQLRLLLYAIVYDGLATDSSDWSLRFSNSLGRPYDSDFVLRSISLNVRCRCQHCTSSGGVPPPSTESTRRMGSCLRSPPLHARTLLHDQRWGLTSSVLRSAVNGCRSPGNGNRLNRMSITWSRGAFIDRSCSVWRWTS